MVKTEIVGAGGYPDHEEIYTAFVYLEPEDISEAILYVLATPPRVQVGTDWVGLILSHFYTVVCVSGS